MHTISNTNISVLYTAPLSSHAPTHLSPISFLSLITFPTSIAIDLNKPLAIFPCSPACPSANTWFSCTRSMAY